MATIYRRQRGETLIASGKTTHHYTREDMGEAIETCSLCHQHTATGFWMAGGEISLCRECAVTKIPLLVADAIVAEDGNANHIMDTAKHTLEQFAASYWRGIAIAVKRQARLDQRTQADQDRQQRRRHRRRTAAPSNN